MNSAPRPAGRAGADGDAVAVRYAVTVNGIDEIVLTKLDVLDRLDTISICTGYRYKGKVYRTFPADIDILTRATPVYQRYPGWRADTAGVKRFGDLPKQAQQYVTCIERHIGTKVRIVSVGSERSQILYKK